MGELITYPTKENKLFEYNDGEGTSMPFDYLPKIQQAWTNTEDFELILLENPYLNKESNVFDIYTDKPDDRIGWIFPISVLESEDLEERGNILNYLYIAYQILLLRINKLEVTKTLLSDYYKNDAIICLVNKRTAPDFHINTYYFSLYWYGYSVLNEDIDCRNVEHYSYDYLKSRIKLTAASKLTTDPVITNLIKQELPTADNLLHRFILLYQAIEHLMEIEAYNKAQNSVNKYNSKSIGIRDLLQELKNQTSEFFIIKEIFSNSSVNKDTLSKFREECRKLFQNASFDPNDKSDISYFYNFRNQIVHSYRKYLTSHGQLGITMQIFERVILELITTYQPVYSQES